MEQNGALMAPVTIEGTYHDGVVDLEHRPAGITRARVEVTFLPSGATAASHDAEGTDQVLERLERFLDKAVDLGGGKFDRAGIYEERMRELERRYR